MSRSKWPDVSTIPPDRLEKEIKAVKSMMRWGEERLQQLQERQDREHALSSLSPDCTHPFTGVSSSTVRHNHVLITTNKCRVCGVSWADRVPAKGKGKKLNRHNNNAPNAANSSTTPAAAHTTKLRQGQTVGNARINYKEQDQWMREVEDRVNNIPW